MTQPVSPEDEWETFRDHSYFDLWCVRRVGARKFGQGFHLMNGIEGKALCDLLNTRTPPPSALDEEVGKGPVSVSPPPQTAIGAVLVWHSAEQLQRIEDNLDRLLDRLKDRGP